MLEGVERIEHLLFFITHLLFESLSLLVVKECPCAGHKHDAAGSNCHQLACRSSSRTKW